MELTRAGPYKSEVMSQPTSPNSLLRHVEWEGWGFPGAGDTVTYLVFDPSERLLDACAQGDPADTQVYRARCFGYVG